MKRLAPGVYDDGEGGLHLVVPELLVAAGYADTPANRQTVEEAARSVFAVFGGDVEVVE